MQTFKIKPEIIYFDTFKEFAETTGLGEKTNRNLFITNERRYNQFIKPLGFEVPAIFRENYGSGEPTDEMINAMMAEADKYDYDRIIAFGGGTIIDIAKVMALRVPKSDTGYSSVELFTGAVPAEKAKELIIIPTTCGTGSEVTNVAIAELKSLKVKKGLASDATYADKAVLIPETLEGMPDYVFATSSIDALIHATESYLSPKATHFTEMYSVKAIETILLGYMEILKRGGNSEENRRDLYKPFLIASTYAGIAFGNAGCGAVHALSYSIGGTFHVPHGEANYQFFTEVFKTYQKKMPEGKISALNSLIAAVTGCRPDEAYDELDCILGQFVKKNNLREYGMTEEQIDIFTQSTVANQQRLLGNNYMPLSDAELREIFANLY
ncbi:MAG: 4-hydroxybutyrate dehydrogenase [Firmicutes bacterium]|nr:4-hydroxybutyrate dehydrogenase [Bacillota bacterium]